MITLFKSAETSFGVRTQLEAEADMADFPCAENI